MRPIEFGRVSSVADAITALRDDTMVIAGGTELLNWQRLAIAEPARLIDLGAVEALRGITRVGDEIVIGALTTLAMIESDPLINAHAASLAEACLRSASPQLRNRATIGGNLLQKTRCPYFRSEWPLPWGCNKRAPGTGCAAREGLNERHALFGWTDDCVATHPADPAVAATCLGADVALEGPHGGRRLPFERLLLTQEEALDEDGDPARRENRLQAGEVITALHLPIIAEQRSAYLKVRERESYEFALVSAAASVSLAEGKIAEARIVLGSVAQRPWRLVKAEAALRGVALDPAVLRPIIEAATDDARPLSRNAFKLVLARNAALRALLMASGIA